MNFSPLLDSVAPIPLHALAAIAALTLGLVQLVAPKGTLSHRTLGWIWVALMAAVAVSSFWIHGHSFRLWSTWSPIHVLSILTPLALIGGIVAARRHRVDAHRFTMIAIFIGGLVIAGLFTFVPGRVMHTVAFGP